MTFLARREPEVRWVERLEQLTPTSTQVNFLRLRWWAGYPRTAAWQPDREVQRWAIYEVTPDLATIPTDLLEDLQHKFSPHTRGKWVHIPRLDERTRSFVTDHRWESSSLVSQEQWELYRETGGYAMLYWIVQGGHGGHRWKLTQPERTLLRMHKAPFDDVPAPGELPYSEPNEATWEALAQRDRLRQWDQGHGAPWESRGGKKAIETLEADREAKKVAFRWELFKWLETQVKERIAPELAAAVRGSDLPAGDRRFDADEEQVHDDFLHDR